MKIQAPNIKSQINSNDLNSKFETAESFDPESFDSELTTEGLVAGQNDPSTVGPMASSPEVPGYARRCDKILINVLDIEY